MPRDYQSYYKDNIDAIDTKWHQFTEIQFCWIIEKLQSKYNPNDHFSVMDLGCGTGRLLALIHDHFPNATLNGIDGTTLMVFRTQNRLPMGTSVKKHDLNSYQLQNNYDVIISTTVLHHLTNPQSHINMIMAHLSPNGTAYISEFALETLPLKLANKWWTWTQAAHIQAWSKDDFNLMLAKADAKINQFDILNPDWFWKLQIYELTR